MKKKINIKPKKTPYFLDYGLSNSTWLFFKKECGFNLRMRGNILKLRSKNDRFKLSKQRASYFFSKFLNPQENEIFFNNPGSFKKNLKERILRLTTYSQETWRHIRALKNITSLRGYRHRVFLPTRGQTTKTNAKTRKKMRKGNNFPLAKKKSKKNNQWIYF